MKYSNWYAQDREHISWDRLVAIALAVVMAPGPESGAAEVLVSITNRAGLATAVAAASDGDTLLLEAGVWSLNDAGIVQIIANDLTIKSADAEDQAILVGNGSERYFENALFVVDSRVTSGPRLENLVVMDVFTFVDLIPDLRISPELEFDCVSGRSLRGTTIIGNRISDVVIGVGGLGKLDNTNISLNIFQDAMFSVDIAGDIDRLTVADNGIVGNSSTAIRVSGSVTDVCTGVTEPRTSNVNIIGNVVLGAENLFSRGIVALNGEGFFIYGNAIIGQYSGIVVGESHGLVADESGPDGVPDTFIDDFDTVGTNTNWGMVSTNLISIACIGGIVAQGARPGIELPADTPAGLFGPRTIIENALIVGNRVSHANHGVLLAGGANGFIVSDNSVQRGGLKCPFRPSGSADYAISTRTTNPGRLDPEPFNNRLVIPESATLLDASAPGDNEIVVESRNP